MRAAAAATLPLPFAYLDASCNSNSSRVGRQQTSHLYDSHAASGIAAHTRYSIRYYARHYVTAAHTFSRASLLRLPRQRRHQICTQGYYDRLRLFCCVSTSSRRRRHALPPPLPRPPRLLPTTRTLPSLPPSPPPSHPPTASPPSLHAFPWLYSLHAPPPPT